MASELNLIKQYRCPYCNARAMQSCKQLRNGERKIYPFASGASSEEWVHPLRREVALKARVIRESPEGLSREQIRKIRETK